MGVGVVVVSLFQIPNQHIIFNEDPLHSRRSEDAIIAFTWNHYQVGRNVNPPVFSIHVV